MTNPRFNILLQKMNEVQDEFFKIQEQIMKTDNVGRSDDPQLYANIGTKFGKGYEAMAEAVGLLAYNEIKAQNRIL